MSDLARITRPEDLAVSIEAARDLIAHCLEVRDFGTLVDALAKAEAIKVYARGRKASLAQQNAAAEMALRFERALGQLCSETVSRGRPKKDSMAESFVSLDDLGISGKESHRWQKLADIAPEAFDAHIEAVKIKGERLTTSGTIAATSDAAGYDGDEWYTPEKYIEAARDVLGTIDLDPCSNPIAQQTVRAAHFYTKDDDARQYGWHGRVWMNPPYSQPLISDMVRLFIEAHEVGDVPAGIVLVNNATDTDWCQSMLRRFSACFTDGRIAFLRANGKAIAGARQGQVFFYAGPDVDLFAQTFSQFGAVLRRAA